MPGTSSYAAARASFEGYDEETGKGIYSVKDRIPTKILANGAIRYGVYDDAGNFLRYEYIKLEDEPTENGDPLGKATLLPDDVATALGLTGNPQVKDAFNALDVMLTGVADPTTATVATKVGQRYLNTANGTLWYCSAVSNGVYTWNLVAGKVPSATSQAFNSGTNADIVKILNSIASAGGWDILNANGSTIVPISRGGTGFSHALVQFGHFSSKSLTFSFPVDFVVLTFGYSNAQGEIWICDMRLKYPVVFQLISAGVQAATVNSTRTTLSWSGYPPVSGNSISDNYNYYALSLLS